MSKRPASSYPVEFFDIWRLAKDGTLSLEFPAKNTAVNFKHRLYAFRRRLLEEGHPEAGGFYEADLDIRENVGLSVNGTATTFWLVPYIPDWKKQLRKQVVERPPEEPTPLEAGQEETFESTLNKFLKD